MSEKTRIVPVSHRGMAQDSFTSANLARALSPEPPKAPPTTGSASDGGSAGKSIGSGNTK